MAEKRTLFERLSNRIFAVPAVAQGWARLSARRTANWVDLSGDAPFVRLRKPLGTARGALITTGGVHLVDQPPFDMETSDGDASYREIATGVDPCLLTITHKYYDHSDADEDLNVVFPLAHFEELVERGVIGGLGRRHFGFMGHIEGEQVATLVGRSAPEVAAKLRSDGVDFAFLTPA